MTAACCSVTCKICCVQVSIPRSITACNKQTKRAQNIFRRKTPSPWLDASTRPTPGGCIGLVGADGCGKSTLLRCLTRLAAPRRSRSPPRASPAVCSSTDTETSTSSNGAPTNLCYDDLRALSFLSSIAYCSEADIIAWKCGEYSQEFSKLYPRARPVQYFNHAPTDSRAFLAVDEDVRRLFLVFRGSGSPRNFATNVNMALVSSTSAAQPSDAPRWPGKVHAGFSEAAAGLYPQIQSALQTAFGAGGDWTVWVTGHSLGAGVGMLVAYLIRTKLDMHPVVCTFAEPMVGDRDFADAWNDAMWQREESSAEQRQPGVGAGTVVRVVHEQDGILSMNEPMWQERGFQHRSGCVCVSHEYSAEGEHKCLDGSSEGSAAAAAKRVAALLPDLKIPGMNMLQHMWYMGTYMGPRL